MQLRDALTGRVFAIQKDLGKTKVLVAMKNTMDVLEYAGNKDLHFFDATAQVQATATLHAKFGNIPEADIQKLPSLEHLLEKSDKGLDDILQCSTTMEKDIQEVGNGSDVVPMRKNAIGRGEQQVVEGWRFSSSWEALGSFCMRSTGTGNRQSAGMQTRSPCFLAISPRRSSASRSCACRNRIAPGRP